MCIKPLFKWGWHVITIDMWEMSAFGYNVIVQIYCINFKVNFHIIALTHCWYIPSDY